FSFRRKVDDGVDGLRVIIIGGRDAGAALIGEMRKSPMAGLVPVAIIDPDDAMHGRWIMGLRVIGGYDQLPAVAEATAAHQAVLDMTSTSSETVRVIAPHAEEAGIALKIV